MGFKSALLVVLSAVTAATAQRVTWGSVVFTYHGEKTPFLAQGSHHLTPLGANQAFDAGQFIRHRYISAAENGSAEDFSPINGISKGDIINSQLDILTTDDEFMTASALAFMQGLYPPRGGDGPPSLAEENMYAPGNRGLGTLLQYPLDGYQYPDIRTVNTVSDFGSIWIAGHLSCDNYSTAEVRYKNTSSYQNRVDSSFSFYQSLRNSVFASISLPASAIDFRSADQLYEYALYEYNHNASIYNPGFTDFRTSDLAKLYDLASEQQYALNSPNSIGSISTIAGRTLAGKVFEQFGHILASNGLSNKLSLMFTSYEPFLSFFALSGLSTGPSASRFKKIPAHGSTMVFELFSKADSNTNFNRTRPFPSIDNLYVRFLFRNGTNPNEQLRAYSLFGNSPRNTDLLYSEFAEGMDDFAMLNVPEWCSVCATQNLFCMQIDEAIGRNSNLPSGSRGTGTSKGALPPAVYGAIGAVVTLAIIFAGLILLAVLGFKLERADKNNRNSDLGHLRTASGNGGFKGAEKLASDTDLRLKGGAGATVIRHERVGSWELNDAPKSPISSLDKDLESGRVRSTVDYGKKSDEYDALERVNPFGDPVKPVDHI